MSVTRQQVLGAYRNLLKAQKQTFKGKKIYIFREHSFFFYSRISLFLSLTPLLRYIGDWTTLAGTTLSQNTSIDIHLFFHFFRKIYITEYSPCTAELREKKKE